MLEVRDLRLIQAIAEHGSLVRAGRVLGIAQPALTRRLAALEARLRGRLFERSRRGVIATDLGRAVLAEAADILGRLAHLDRHLAAVRGDQTSELAIAAGAYVGESVAMAAAARMLAQYPATRIRMLSMNWTEVPRAVIDREAPIGLLDLRGLPDDPGLVVEPLRPQPGVFVVRSDHPLTRLAHPVLADIMAHPLIFIGRVPRHVQAPMAAAREAARAAGAMHPAMPALVHESPTVALGVLRHSDAVAAATFPIAASALRSGEIVALPWRAPWLSVHPGILRLRNRKPAEVEQAFLDLLLTADREFAAEAQPWCARIGVSPECG